MKTVGKKHWLKITLIVLVACGIAGLILAAVLNTNEESITYEGNILTLPAYSIAVFTV